MHARWCCMVGDRTWIAPWSFYIYQYRWRRSVHFLLRRLWGCGRWKGSKLTQDSICAIPETAVYRDGNFICWETGRETSLIRRKKRPINFTCYTQLKRLPSLQIVYAVPQKNGFCHQVRQKKKITVLKYLNINISTISCRSIELAEASVVCHPQRESSVSDKYYQWHRSQTQRDRQ